MRPVSEFELIRPPTLAEAAALLGRGGARLVAGGTDLLPNLRRGLLTPRLLVDLGGIADFAEVQMQAGRSRIGAGVTLSNLARDDRIAKVFPALAQAAGMVAGPGHRSVATLGGNLCQDTRCVFYNQSEWWREANGWCLKLRGETCHVAPQGKRCHAAFSGDLAPVLLAYDAEVEIAAAARNRRIPLADLYRDDGAAHLALAPDEIVAAVGVPHPEPGSAGAYGKVRARAAMDFPLAGVAVVLRVRGGALAALAIGVGGTDSRPLRIEGTDALLGRPLDETTLQAVSRLVRQQVSPMRSTVTASNYRRLAAAALAVRLVSELGSMSPP